MKRFFVVGTDTGVGKTTVSVALLTAARHMGHTTAALKPAESGCTRGEDGTLLPNDAQALLSASTSQRHLSEVCCYRFEQPVAPGVAAADIGEPIDMSRIVSTARTIENNQPDLFLVEGAGGLLVPLSSTHLIADLALMLTYPVLIVARAGLGTINHTLLTLEVARARGLSIAGFIFSSETTQLDPQFIERNAREISRVHNARYLGCLPHATSLDSTRFEDAASDIFSQL